MANTRGRPPGNTFKRAAAALRQSRFDTQRNLIVVNNGHRGFVFATKNRALQLPYLCDCTSKELVRTSQAFPADQLLERMVELSLYCRGKLRWGDGV